MSALSWDEIGLVCSVRSVVRRDSGGKIQFWAEFENFFSASLMLPTGDPAKCYAKILKEYRQWRRSKKS